MIRMTFGVPVDMRGDLPPEILAIVDAASVVQETSRNRVSVATPAGASVVITGVFDFGSEATLAASAVTGLIVRDEDLALVFSLTGLRGLTFGDFDDNTAALDTALASIRDGVTVTGSHGDDVLIGDRGADVLIGRGGNDVVNGASGNDRLNGGTGNDRINGGTGNDRLEGAAGDDVLNGGAGADTMLGGTGNDRYWVNSAQDTVTETATGGSDSVYASTSFRLPAYVENLTLTGSGAISATGNGLANTLIGNAAANILTAGGGKDVLDGGLGSDRMLGGSGDDVYHVDHTGDRVIETAGQGSDTVFSSIGYRLPAHVEMLRLTGTGNLDGTGNGLANTLVGNAGDNTLRGGGGDDILVLGAGIDTGIGGAGNDDYLLNAEPDAAGPDHIRYFLSGSDRLLLDLSIFGALTPGTQTAANFITAGMLADGDDYLRFDPADGTLYYDAAGDGAGTPLAVVSLGAGAMLAAGDIVAVNAILAPGLDLATLVI
ncbi:MAG: calcium-binding protein [Gammaproteobacteria bacterium]|nr:calcium-binding protein [Gammaproteobacteria bacterium]